MADFIKVDTAHVVSTANNISNLNNKIRDEFSSVESAIKALENVWSGEASAKGISSFYELKSAFNEPRYTVADNVVRFLKEQVNAGYTQTENENKSLAHLFK